MKQLMFLISTAGKAPEQITKEVWTAFQKFQKVHKESLKNLKQIENKKSTDKNVEKNKMPKLSKKKKNRIVDVTLEHLGEGFVFYKN